MTWYVWTAFVFGLVGLLAWTQADQLLQSHALRQAFAPYHLVGVLTYPNSKVLCETEKGYMFVAKNAVGGSVVGKVCPGPKVHIMINSKRDYPRA